MKLNGFRDPDLRVPEVPYGYKNAARLVMKDKIMRHIVVGVRRFELPASWSRTKHATICATPRYGRPCRRPIEFYLQTSELSTKIMHNSSMIFQYRPD